MSHMQACTIQAQESKGQVQIGRRDQDRNPVQGCLVLPLMRRLFANPRETKRLQWHHDERIVDRFMRHPKDGPQWELIDKKFENFAKDPRSIRLGECTDGMNPFGDMSTNHSTWPVLLCIYNLAPWLCMKKKYIMMSMIIQGLKQPGNDIDIYFQLLVEELLTVWIDAPVVKIL